MRFYSTDFGISKMDAVSGTVCCEAQAEYRHCSHLGVFKKGMRQIRLRKQPKAIKLLQKLGGLDSLLIELLSQH